MNIEDHEESRDFLVEQEIDFRIEKQLYVLTDGDDVYDQREMDIIDLNLAERIAKESFDGDLYWMPAKEFPEGGLIKEAV